MFCCPYGHIILRLFYRETDASRHKRQKRRSQKCSLSLNYANGAPWLDQRRRFKKEGHEAKPHAFTTAVLAARSPTRCFLSYVQIRMAPSKYGIKNGMASTTRRMLRTAAPA